MYQFLGHQTGLLAGGRVRQEVLEGATELPPEAAPGVETMERYTLVVGYGPREAETERCTPGEFVDRFGLKLAQEAVAQAAVSDEPAVVGTELMDSEIWPWLAMLLLVTVVAEALVANRTAA